MALAAADTSSLVRESEGEAAKASADPAVTPAAHANAGQGFARVWCDFGPDARRVGA